MESSGLELTSLRKLSGNRQLVDDRYVFTTDYCHWHVRLLTGIYIRLCFAF